MLYLPFGLVRDLAGSHLRPQCHRKHEQQQAQDDTPQFVRYAQVIEFHWQPFVSVSGLPQTQLVFSAGPSADMLCSSAIFHRY